MNNISWPIHRQLESLTIGTCTLRQYKTILHNLPHLRTFVLRDCMENDNDNRIRSACASPISSHLKSLALTGCSMPIASLESILLLTPTIHHLKVIFSSNKFDFAPDGSRWEQLIKTKLRHLDKFEFFFSYIFPARQDSPFVSLDSLIAPYRTPFWTEEKRWFVTCDYVYGSSTIRIYTTPIKIIAVKDSFRCEISSKESVCRLTRRPIHTMADDISEEVCRKTLL